MEYNRDDSFPFGFEPNGIPFGLKTKGKLSPPTYSIIYIQFGSKTKGKLSPRSHSIIYIQFENKMEI